MTGALLYTATHTQSHRSVIVMHEVDSVWAYLTAPASTTPVADCWLLNLVEAPDNLDAWRDTKSVPPVTRRYLLQGEPHALPDHDSISIRWSVDGNAVLIEIDDQPAGFIVAAQKHGYSAGLIAPGPFGQPFDHQLASRIFD